MEGLRTAAETTDVHVRCRWNCIGAPSVMSPQTSSQPDYCLWAANTPLHRTCMCLSLRTHPATHLVVLLDAEGQQRHHNTAVGLLVNLLVVRLQGKSSMAKDKEKGETDQGPGNYDCPKRLMVWQLESCKARSIDDSNLSRRRLNLYKHIYILLLGSGPPTSCQPLCDFTPPSYGMLSSAAN